MLVERLDRLFYPDFSNNWDDAFFRKKILHFIKPDMVALDLGAGAGIVPQMNFKDIFKKVSGIDLDPRVVENPFLHEGKITDGKAIPYPDHVFDIVFSDNVLEHLEKPEEVFGEVNRVLKPGGLFIAKTPHKYGYVSLLARLTPLWFHRYYNKLRGREGIDTFPTLYRANATSDIKRIIKEMSFDEVEYDFLEGRPEYLRLNFLTYLIGILYERIVNNVPFMKCFKNVFIVVLRKEGGCDKAIVN